MARPCRLERRNKSAAIWGTPAHDATSSGRQLVTRCGLWMLSRLSDQRVGLAPAAAPGEVAA
jgi:hypothetical protein